MRKEDKVKYNYKRIEVYLTPKDAALFEKKAVHYKKTGGHSSVMLLSSSTT